MPLKKVREDLQKKDSAYAKRGHSITPYNEWERTAQEGSVSGGVWTRTKGKLAKVQMTATLWAIVVLGVVFVLSVAIISLVRYQASYFNVENVHFAVEAPRDIESNRGLEVTLVYANETRADLKNAEIVMRFDEYFTPEETAEFRITGEKSGVITVGDIPAGTTGRTTIVGQFIAPQNEVEVLDATLTYDVGRGVGSKQQKASTSVTITSSPLIVDILAPAEVASGNLIDLRVLYRNSGEEQIDDVGMRIDFPEGFTYRDATPKPSKGNDTWSFGTLESDEQGEIAVQGLLSGPVGDIRTFNAQMVRGTGESTLRYTRDEHSFRIADTPLMISQEIVGKRDAVIQAGDRLEHVVRFRNAGDVPLRNIILRAFIDGGEIVEYDQTRALGGGFFDPAKRTIEWRAVDVPALAALNPGQEGQVSFILSIKNRIPVNDASDSKITISTLVSADSPDFPDILSENKNVLSNTLVSRLATKLLLQTDVQPISGPFPLSQGEETVFRVTLGVGTVTNSVAGASVRVNVPTGMRVVDVVSSAGDDIIHNDRSGEIIWNIGLVKNGVGILTPYDTATIDIGLTPQGAGVTRDQSLLQNLRYEATDLFVSRDVTITGSDISTGDGLNQL